MLYVVSIFIVLAALAGVVYFIFVKDRSNVYQKALDLAQRGDYTDARGMVRARISRDPDDVLAHHTLARVYALEGNDESELSHLLEVRRIGSYTQEITPIQVLNRIGEIHYQRDRYRESFEIYMESQRFSQTNEEALAHLAFMAIGQGEFDVAETFFRKLVRSAPNVAEYHIARGVGLAVLKNKEAMKELELGLALEPNDQTARFLNCLQATRQTETNKAKELLDSLLPMVTSPQVMHITNRLAVSVFYMMRDFNKALEHAERVLVSAVKEGWEQEEYDARLSVAYMAMLSGQMEKANENLLELEIRNPSDDLVLKISDFRMDLEEGAATVDKVSPRGFDFTTHLQDWLRRRFPDDAIYQLSGLRMDERFAVLDFFTKDGSPRMRTAEIQIDPAALIEKFNSLRDDGFMAACEGIIGIQGYRIEKTLPYRDRDGADFVAVEKGEKKTKALFRIRKWKNQPISDIFLRDMQNYMNELKVSGGFVVAGARLTSGAEEALKNLRKITVINEYDLGSVLQKVLR